MLHNAESLWVWLQSMYDRKQLVGSYNWLCSKLLDVQVTLSQNKPQTMSDQDRNVAAAKFQHSMQVRCPPQMLPGMSIQPCSCLHEPQVAFPTALSCQLVLRSRVLHRFMQICVRCIRIPIYAVDNGFSRCCSGMAVLKYALACRRWTLSAQE